MSDKYILVGRQPTPCDDLLKWSRWYQENERHVGDETIGDVRVSTIFLGLDLSWGEGDPLLFETMVFGGEHDQWQDRYATYEEAESGHKRVVNAITAGEALE